ncbi:restriction endonuclease subunit S (plasmid) [Rubrivivax sp. RP6-9]|uniref:restriction endonuclease subunit S n=1 Tax=Rubrivivax sp. RP6-9 TaxID=3415750 RepID=UPI003CC57271
MLPEGWRRARLDAVARRASGHTPNKGESSYWNGGIKWVSLADSWRLDRGYIAVTEHEISEEGIKNSSAVLLPAGTVILSRDAGVGKSAVLAEPMAVSQHFIGWDCSVSNDLHNWFLYHWLQREKPEFERIAVGSTIKTIGLPFFVRLEIDLPPLVEQQRIAQILSTWDEAIESAVRLASNAKMAMSAMIEQSILRGVKQGAWPLRHLSDVATRVQRSEVAEPDLPVLMISSGAGFLRQDEKYSRFMAGKSVQNYIALEEGEFAYNKGNSKRYEFGCVYPLKGLPKGLVPHVYVCFRLKDGHHAGFFEHLFAADFLHDQLGALVNTGVRNNGLLNIRPADFMACKVPVPPRDEQQTIAARLEVAAEWVRRSDEYAARLRNEKAALLADLLTGKRRVRIPAAETAP